MSRTILAIGDIHGRDIWKKIVEQPADAIVFIGDYWDSWHEPYDKQRDNFQAIIEYAKNNRGKVYLLVGNHDFQYMMDDERYSGYQSSRDKDIRSMLQYARDEALLQAAHSEGGFLFTHAGVTKTWMEKYAKDYHKPWSSATINQMFVFNKDAFKFDHADSSGCGEYSAQSPIWVRPKSLMRDMYGRLTQVVGHTQMPDITHVTDSNAIFIDALETGKYLKIIDGKPESATV